MRSILCLALSLMQVVLLGRILLSWFPESDGLRPVMNALRVATDWILVPLRRALPPLSLGGMGLDLSPMVVLLVIALLQGRVC